MDRNEKQNSYKNVTSQRGRRIKKLRHRFFFISGVGLMLVAAAVFSVFAARFFFRGHEEKAIKMQTKQVSETGIERE